MVQRLELRTILRTAQSDLLATCRICASKNCDIVVRESAFIALPVASCLGIADETQDFVTRRARNDLDLAYKPSALLHHPSK